VNEKGPSLYNPEIVQHTCIPVYLEGTSECVLVALVGNGVGGVRVHWCMHAIVHGMVACLYIHVVIILDDASDWRLADGKHSCLNGSLGGRVYMEGPFPIPWLPVWQHVLSFHNQ